MSPQVRRWLCQMVEERPDMSCTEIADALCISLTQVLTEARRQSQPWRLANPASRRREEAA